MLTPSFNKILKTTLSYYSCWIGENDILNKTKDGIHFLYSEERNQRQQGYHVPFDVYIFLDQNRLFVSYGRKAIDRIEGFREKAKDVFDVGELKQLLFETFETKPRHNIKYVFTGQKSLPSNASVLEESDFPKFRAFFEECHSTTAGDWLYEWYLDMVNQKLCCGYIKDDILVSCTDTPDMPYMSNRVQEIGINTLQQYRGKGYASDCCLQCISKIIQNNKCPIWSTTANNLASQKLAEKLGFSKLADVLTLTL